jgi:hypothetical protein
MVKNLTKEITENISCSKIQIEQKKGTTGLITKVNGILKSVFLELNHSLKPWLATNFLLWLSSCT